MTAGGHVPVKTIAFNNSLPQYPRQRAVDDEERRGPPPAFPGAMHDANGRCIAHSKILLAQPIFAEDEKNNGASGPIKYRTVRKTCPSCRVQQLLVQENVRELRRQSSCGTKHDVKPVSRRQNDGDMHRNRREADKNKKGSVLTVKKEQCKGKDTAKANDGGKEKEKHVKGEVVAMPKDRGFGKDINPARGATRTVRQESLQRCQSKKDAIRKELKHVDEKGVHHYTKQGADGTALTRKPSIPKRTVKFTKGGSQSKICTKPLGRKEKGERDDKIDEEGEHATAGVSMMAAGLPLHKRGSRTESGNEEKNIKDDAKNDNHKNKEKSLDALTRLQFPKASAGERHKKPADGNKDKPEHGKSRENQSMKAPVKSTKEVPHRTVKFTRGGSQSNICTKTENVKDDAKNDNQENEEKSLDALTGLQFPKVGAGERHKKNTGSNKDKPEHGKSRENQNKKAPGKSTKEVPHSPGKMTDGNKDKPEHGKLKESQNTKAPGKSTKEVPHGPGKMDFSKLWKASDPVGKEAQSKGKPARSSNDRDSGERVDKSVDPCKSSDNNHGNDAVGHQGDKSEDSGSKKIDGRDGDAKNHKAARRRSKNDEKVHFHPGRSVSPGRGKGDCTDEDDGDGRRGRHQQKRSPHRPTRSSNNKDSGKCVDKSVDPCKSSDNNHSNDAAGNQGGKSEGSGSKKIDGCDGNAKNHKAARGRSKNDEKVHFHPGRSVSPGKGKEGDRADGDGRRGRHQRNGSPPRPERRKRVPSEHHIHHLPRQAPTLFNYQQAFFEEMAQSNMVRE